MASGLDFGCGKEDPDVKNRLAMERQLMSEVAKHARAQKGERVVFANPNKKDAAAKPAPQQAIAPASPVKPVDPAKEQRLKVEQDMIAEMRRKKEAEDGGTLPVSIMKWS